jgi:hypothetical protein
MYQDAALQPQQHVNNNPSFEQAALIGALTDMSLHGDNSGPWIADSGTSAHLSDTRGILTSSRPVFQHAPVIVGNGSHIPVTHIGRTSVPSSSRPLHLHNVLVTPQIVQNLLFVSLPLTIP